MIGSSRASSSRWRSSACCRSLLLCGGNCASITPAPGAAVLFWPLFDRGLGSAMMFLPLSIATLGSIPKRDVPAASGFYNLTRQLGGSLGIAILTTMLSRREAVHRAALVEHI